MHDDNHIQRECSEILAARILALKSSPSALADSNTVDNSLSSDDG